MTGSVASIGSVTVTLTNAAGVGEHREPHIPVTLKMLPVALTIAGSDPCGGAGLQADLKTFHQFGVYGEAVVTLITVQNTVALERVETLAPDLVLAQIRAVLSDIPPRAAKTGALGSRRGDGSGRGGSERFHVSVGRGSGDDFQAWRADSADAIVVRTVDRGGHIC